MPQTNPNVGRALAELSAGKADKLNIEPVALDGAAQDPMPVSVVTPAGDIISQAQQVVGPTATPAPNSGTLQNVALPSSGMTLEQAQAIVASLNPDALQIGPTAAPATNGAVANPPATIGNNAQPIAAASPSQQSPVDLEALSQQQMSDHLFGTATPAPVQPVAPPVQQVAQPQAPTPQEPSRVVIPEDALVDTPLGAIPWREAKGNMLRRQEFERQRREVLETKRTVENQQHLIHKVAQSPFGAAYTAALNAGANDADAINAGLSASGVQRAAEPQAAPEQPLVPPDENDPQFQTKYAVYLSEISARAARDAVRREVDPLRQQLSAQQQATVQNQTREAQQQRDVQAALSHNKELFGAYVEPMIPQGLNDTQRQVITDHLNSVAAAEGITIDVNRKMSDESFRLLAAYAFPNGQLPSQIIARLAGVPTPSYTTQQVLQPPSPNGAIASPNGSTNGAIPPALAALPEWQKTALLQQAMQTLQAYRNVVGAPIPGTLPGLPQSPALQAGPNPSAATIGATMATPMARPEERIRATMQSIPRAA